MILHVYSKLLLAGLLLAGMYAAADDQPETSGNDGGGRSEERRGGRGGRGGRSGMRERMAEIQKTLKEKYPQEYAAIEKLQETDRRSAMRQTMELARKAGIEMPFGRHGMSRRSEGPQALPEEWQNLFKQLKEKYPEEFAAIEKKLASDPQASRKELQELVAKAGLKMPETDFPPMQSEQPALNRNRNRLMVARANEILKKEYPQEYAELEKLREKDDDAAREKFRAMAAKAELTPEKLLDAPIPPVQNVSYSDKDIEAQDPSATGSSRSWGGGWGGGRGGFGGRSGWGGGNNGRGGFGGGWGGGFGGGMPPPRF